MKRPGLYAPLALDFFMHPKTARVRMVHDLAPYGFLYLIAKETEARLTTHHPSVVLDRWDTFEMATGIHATDANPSVQALIRRCLGAYQLVGWIEILAEDDLGFRVRLRNSDAWAGEVANPPKRRREEKKEEQEDSDEFSPETREVFEYWKKATSTAKARLGTQVARCIRGRLREGLTVVDLCLAIDGCVNDPWHKAKRKWELSYIFRNNEKTIGFMAKAPRGSTNFNEDMGIA